MTKKTIIIYLDAHFDLRSAGYPCGDDDVTAFEEAYKVAAELEAEARGIDIAVEPGGEMHVERMDDEQERIWQAIHDRVKWGSDGWVVR